MTATDNISVEERLYHVQESTNDDGTINVEISDWYDEGDVILIEYQLPTGQYESERFTFPQRATDEYELVRLAEGCGYSLVNLDQLVGERVKYDDGLVVPEHTSTVECIVSRLVPESPFREGGDFLLGVLLWPIVSIIVVFWPSGNEFYHGMRVSAFGTWLWVLFLVVLFVVIL